MVFTEPRTAQGQRGAVLRLDSAALGLVARLRLRAFDPKALGLDGGARADGEEADFLVFLEPRNAQGQRGALLRLHSAASGLIAGVRLRAFDPKAFGLDGGARTEGEEADVVVFTEPRAAQGQGGALLRLHSATARPVDRVRAGAEHLQPLGG